MFAKLINIIKNSIKRKNISIIIDKILIRILESSSNKKNHSRNIKWCKDHSEPYDSFLKSLDPDLWAETQTICKKIEDNAHKKLEQINIDLGGGGNYPLLYFFTRYTNAETIVETGVAAGWSSQAILTAMQTNNTGKLYSSDFPYFRQDSPEKLVGYLVDDELKENWSLAIDGDQNNLPEFLTKIKEIDLFHYDSDKSYKGRSFASNLIIPKCHKNSVIIFDDIQDNSHFKDYVTNSKTPFKVFEFQGKYVGLIADFINNK